MLYVLDDKPSTLAGRPLLRIGSPLSGSILMTLAPISASIAPALGAAIQLSISITVISSSGAGTISPETVNLVGKANTTWCNCLNTENLA